MRNGFCLRASFVLTSCWWGCKVGEPERFDGSTRAGTYLRSHRPKRSDSPRLLPLRPSSRCLDRGGKLAQSVSEARGQAGRWPTHRRQRRTPSSPARSAPAWTARPPQRLRVLCARDAHTKHERVRRGAERGRLRPLEPCIQQRSSKRLSVGSRAGTAQPGVGFRGLQNSHCNLI